MSNETKKKVTRRDFLKKAAVAGASVAAAGTAGAWSAPGQGPAMAPAAQARDQQTDVLVIGMGFAGLCAAARALEKGAKNVVLIDKQPRNWWTPGGNLVVAAGTVHLSSTSLHAPKDKIASAVTANTSGMVPADLLATTVDNAGRALDWVIAKGATFREPAGGELSLTPVMPPPVWGRIKSGGIQDAAKQGGKQLANKLEDFIVKNGGKLLFQTKAVDFLTNSNGNVTGARVQDKDGRFDIKASAVILASGGYEMNREMLVKYTGPHGDEVIRFGHPAATGDGITMASKLNAGLRAMNYVAFSHYYSVDAFYKPDLVGAYLDTLGTTAILVDMDGNRFFDESLGARVGGSLTAKTSIYVRRTMIFDDAIYNLPIVKPRVDDVKEFGGTILTANTIEELATKAGVGPRLALTVAEYNKAVADKTAASLAVPRRSGANAIAKPPFYAAPYVPGIVASYGGLTVNTKAQVLDVDGQVIPGLYAAGLAMEGSMSGGIDNAAGAYAGCLSLCLIFGLLAAEDAVTRIQKT